MLLYEAYCGRPRLEITHLPLSCPVSTDTSLFDVITTHQAVGLGSVPSVSWSTRRSSQAGSYSSQTEAGMDHSTTTTPHTIYSLIAHRSIPMPSISLYPNLAAKWLAWNGMATTCKISWSGNLTSTTKSRCMQPSYQFWLSTDTETELLAWTRVDSSQPELNNHKTKLGENENEKGVWRGAHDIDWRDL